MVDIVFVIMLFFMVMAGAVKVEREIGTKLPSGCGQDISHDDELWIKIDEDGAVFLNDDKIVSEKDANFSKLTQILCQISSQSHANGARDIVTIQTEPQTKYQRVVDVLNSLANAKIADVTFTVGDEEL
ncbi:MAG: biopolymer transporter ExbD [Verrucomicrobia bacterium]|nr:biopolymer transporter ExbD [Verrucomicrobiota bacterium]